MDEFAPLPPTVPRMEECVTKPLVSIAVMRPTRPRVIDGSQSGVKDKDLYPRAR